MIEALLYQVRVRVVTKTRVEITFVPTWLGRMLGRKTRVGIACGGCDDGGYTCWWWSATNRYVGFHIERNIEAAPRLSLDDMSVEDLLLEPSTTNKPGRR